MSWREIVQGEIKRAARGQIRKTECEGPRGEKVYILFFSRENVEQAIESLRAIADGMEDKT